MIRGFLALIALLAALPSFAQVSGRPEKLSQDSVPWVLQKAIKEGSKLRYIGTRSIQVRKDGQIQKYNEIVTGDGSSLRIDFPADAPYAGQVIVETATERRHFFPDTNEIQVFPPRREEAMFRLGRLAKMTNRIHLTTAEGEVVAGIPTSVVIVRDQNDNIQQKLYISKVGMLLKRQFFDRVGTAVGGFEFIRIDMTPNIPAGTFKLERHGARIVRPLDQLRDAATKAGFPFAHLKDSSGYALMFSRLSKIEGNDAVMQFYSQEGKRLSLFQLKAEVNPNQLGRFAHDVQVYTWTERGFTYVLIGGQDPDALKTLAGQVAIGN